MQFDVNDFKYTGQGEFKLSDFPTNIVEDDALKKEYEDLTKENTKAIAELQEMLYAEKKEGIILALQAHDAAGKDSAIRKVLSGINPTGIKVCSFKTPTNAELSHDYLWRVEAALPPRGCLGVLNRTHYEDVLVVRVHEMWKGYSWADRCFDMPENEFFQMRFEHIKSFEDHIYQSGFRWVKVFLNVSPEEQRNRFLRRIDTPEKNWKFSAGDIKERAYWDEYMKAYESAIAGTATENAPWYIIPADSKWMARYLLSCALREAYEACDPKYPVLSEEDRAVMMECRAQLLAELGAVDSYEAAEKKAAEKEEKKAKKEKKHKKDKGEED